MKKPTVNHRSYFNQCILCYSSFKVPQNHSHPICPSCHSDLPWINERCSICALPFDGSPPSGLICGQCLKKTPSFDKVHAALHYQFPIDVMIGQIKYDKKTQFIDALAQLLNLSAPALDGIEALIPTPLSRRSLTQRGFNQAELIAKNLSRRRQIPVNTKLIRKVKETEHQMGLPRKQRVKNLISAFACAPNDYQHVALIDDVMTTGTTLEELSRCLKASGIQKVTCLVLARTDK